MGEIYFHIPFCRNACHYCDFHFSITMAYCERMIYAMSLETRKRKGYLKGSKINTIYFGGGTPSFIPAEYIGLLFDTVKENFKIGKRPEITLEANPEDINPGFLEKILKIGINRLSIGIQSFNNKDLRFLNRNHSLSQAKNSIITARNAGFKNINIDLIYGFPGLTQKKWIKNIETAIDFHVEHLSAYHITYEPSTILYYRKNKKRINSVSENQSLKQFMELAERMKRTGYIQYEISNFARKGFHSRHNSGYWLQIPYLGIGPSAHSYNGVTRQWNIARNMSYMKQVEKNENFSETEILDLHTKYHDYIMTSIRTMWGTDEDYIKNKFGLKYYKYFKTHVKKFIDSGDLKQNENKYFLTEKGMCITDFITKSLF